MQRHPFKQLIMHLDFQRVDANQALRTKVQLHFLNQDSSPAGKTGGVVVMHELTEEMCIRDRPITAQTWVLQSDAQGAQLQGMPQGPQQGADAATLLRTATGWDIPVQALGCWMRAAFSYTHLDVYKRQI